MIKRRTKSYNHGIKTPVAMFALLTALIWLSLGTESHAAEIPAGQLSHQTSHETSFRAVEINGVEVFYREAGPRDAPTILLLHGFPTSSHMFRNLIPALSDRFHLVAPDYPGFGNSEQPGLDEFDYTFDGLADLMEGFITELGIDKYSVYLMDYGAPVGFRLAARHPERVQALIVQCGNAY